MKGDLPNSRFWRPVVGERARRRMLRWPASLSVTPSKGRYRMGSSTSISVRISTDNARIAGTQKYCSTQPSILIEGTQYTPPEVIAIYQNDLGALAAVAAARLALSEAVAKAKQVSQVRDDFDKGFKRAIQGAYGNSPATMGTFGIASAPPKAPSVATKAAAREQAEATRVLRHTMSKKQKAEIKAAPVGATGTSAPTTAAVSSGTGGGGAKS